MKISQKGSTYVSLIAQLAVPMGKGTHRKLKPKQPLGNISELFCHSQSVYMRPAVFYEPGRMAQGSTKLLQKTLHLSSCFGVVSDME